MKDVVDAHQREFEPNQDFENVQLEENSQEVLIDDEFQEEETTPSEEIADFISKQGKIYGGVEVKLDCRRKSSYAPALTLWIVSSARLIFDELMNHDSEEPIFLYLYGKAQIML